MSIQKVDIAICTWCRDRLLAQTFDSLLKLRVPESVELNVIVVDNNSTDHTPAVIESFKKSAAALARPFSVLSLKESKQGHAHCRNLAIENADSDLMLWTDDDVIVADNWLERMVEGADSQHESVFWGSVIKPVFPDGCPPWVIENWENVKGCFAERDLGEQALEFTHQRLPYGANFAVRTETQKANRFLPELGRMGEIVFGEDELDLFRRLLRSGNRGNWVPDAVVEHVIPKERTSETFVYNYFVGQGQALVAKSEPWHSDVAKFKSESRSEFFKYKLKRPFANSTTWVSHMLRSALAQGQFLELSNQEKGAG